MHVVVVGAGLGGLVLAQALVRDGDEVTVLERDADLSAGGYRIALTGEACTVLRDTLPTQVFQAVQAISASREAFRRFHFVDSRMHVLAVEDLPLQEQALLVDRAALRELLTNGLDGRIHFGTRVVDVQTDDDGRPSVRAQDGSLLSADLVVGADGAGSVVSRVMAGRPLGQPCGLDGTAGRVWLDGEGAALLPSFLRRGPAIAIGPRGFGMFLSVQDPRRTVVDPRLSGMRHEGRAALVWGGIAPSPRFPDSLDRRDGRAILSLVLGFIDGWDAGLRGLVSRTDPDEVALFRFLAADPDAPLVPWPAGGVTALGDAVHVMPPTGGQAGATAIRDAGALAQRLREVRSGAVGLGTAVADFHRDMQAYAPDAVRESLVPVRAILATGSGPLGALSSVALPLVARVSDHVLRLRGRLG